MATKKNAPKVTETPTDGTFKELDARVTALEKLVQQLVSQKPKVRKQREYTEEERAKIRARLLAGQEAARKKREVEIKVTKKVKPGNSEITKIAEPEKLITA